MTERNYFPFNLEPFEKTYIEVYISEHSIPHYGKPVWINVNNGT